MPKKAAQRTRLMIDFPSVDAMKDWVRASIADETLPPETAIYSMDGLDDTKASGVTPANTYIVRRAGDRPMQMRLPLANIEQAEE